MFRCGICWYESNLPDIERYHQSIYEWNDLQKHEHGISDYWKIELIEI